MLQFLAPECCHASTLPCAQGRIGEGKTPGRLSSVTSGANMRSRAVDPFPSLDFEWRLARFQLAGEMLAAYTPPDWSLCGQSLAIQTFSEWEVNPRSPQHSQVSGPLDQSLL